MLFSSIVKGAIELAKENGSHVIWVNGEGEAPTTGLLVAYADFRQVIPADDYQAIYKEVFFKLSAEYEELGEGNVDAVQLYVDGDLMVIDLVKAFRNIEEVNGHQQKLQIVYNLDDGVSFLIDD